MKKVLALIAAIVGLFVTVPAIVFVFSMMLGYNIDLAWNEALNMLRGLTVAAGFIAVMFTIGGFIVLIGAILGAGNTEE